jgi:hypothetical protein
MDFLLPDPGDRPPGGVTSFRAHLVLRKLDARHSFGLPRRGFDGSAGKIREAAPEILSRTVENCSLSAAGRAFVEEIEESAARACARDVGWRRTRTLENEPGMCDLCPVEIAGLG